eukprot:scaffold1.g5677.t1
MSSVSHAEAPLTLTLLPPDIQWLIFHHLSGVHVSKAWRQASEAPAVWIAAQQRDFPHAELAGKLLAQRAAGVPGGTGDSGEASSARNGGSSSRGHDFWAEVTSPQHKPAAKLVYKLLAARHTCDRCKKEFCDGDNDQGSCTFHPGVLFSGGQLNGAGLRFTCCNRRAHHIPTFSPDGNGCKTGPHVCAAGQSAWEADLSGGVRPRIVLSTPTSCVSMGSSSSGGAGAGSSSVRGTASSSRVGGATHRGGSPVGSLPVEWHPNVRPWGMLELPSRLLTSL